MFGKVNDYCLSPTALQDKISELESDIRQLNKKVNVLEGVIKTIEDHKKVIELLVHPIDFMTALNSIKK